MLPVQLAGRGWRLRDAPVTDLGTLADQVAEAIVAQADAPVAVFGHSMGAWVGLEVVRRLERAGVDQLLLFASGRQAPVLGCTQPRMSHLDDAGFVREVQTRYGGIPEEVLGEPDLLSLLLPALRADIRLLEVYRHGSQTPITAPIHALVGSADEVVSIDEMAPWADETNGAFGMTTVPGGHFYFQPDPRALLDIIHDRLNWARGHSSVAARGFDEG